MSTAAAAAATSASVGVCAECRLEYDAKGRCGCYLLDGAPKIDLTDEDEAHVMALIEEAMADEDKRDAEEAEHAQAFVRSELFAEAHDQYQIATGGTRGVSADDDDGPTLPEWCDPLKVPHIPTSSTGT